MNENLINKMKNTKISQYRLSHETGVPYTTISRLARGAMDVNNCSAEAVHRLALYFDCSMEDLLNPSAYLPGISGVYRGYHYRWESGKGQDLLVIEKGDEKFSREFGRPKTNKKYYESSKAFAEMEIDLCIKKKEADRICGIITKQKISPTS